MHGGVVILFDLLSEGLVELIDRRQIEIANEELIDCVWHCQLRVPLAVPVRTKELILTKSSLPNEMIST